MAHMVKVRTGPPGSAVLWYAAGRGEFRYRPSIRWTQTRSNATNAAIRESSVEYPAGVPPIPVSQGSNVQLRKEAIKNAKPFSDFLTDTFHRQHDYLRISITERCNLRCLYCMPEEGIPLSPPANMLTTPEIFYLSSLFVSQGVTKIRLTGGEPTVRRDIVPLMQQIGSLRPKGLRELALTTNGISLHRKLDAMVEAGLTGVNLSLDTLDPFQFQIMTRRKGFDAVMKSIDRILEMNKMGAGVKLKVNCVVMRGLNEREILPFVEMGREKDIEVRFIEYMPFGGNKWSENKMISFQEMLDIIRTKYPGLRRLPGHKNDTSKTYEVPGFVGKVGFITSMTNDFCGSCNRLRITSDGNLKVCLHGNAEVSLRDLLRQGNGGEPIDQEAFERIRQLEMDRHEGRLSDETALGWGERERELLETIGVAVKKKAEKHADLNDLANMENRPMILIDRNISASYPDLPWSLSQGRVTNGNATSSRLPRGFNALTSGSLDLGTGVSPSRASIRMFGTTPNHVAGGRYKIRKILVDAKNAESNSVQSIERKIRLIERRITVEKSSHSAAPSKYNEPSKSALTNTPSDLQIKDTPKTKRAKWRERKRIAARLAEEKATVEADHTGANSKQELKIRELESLLETHKKSLEAAKKASKKRPDTLGKEKLLTKEEVLSQDCEREVEVRQQVKTVNQSSTVKVPTSNPESFDLGDILDHAVFKHEQASREYDTQQRRKVHAKDVRNLATRQTTVSKQEMNEKMGIDTVAPIKRASSFRGRTKLQDQEKSAALDNMVSGSKFLAQSIPFSWSSPQQIDTSPNSSPPPSHTDAKAFSTPQYSSSDSLRLQVPASGLVYIDSDLTADFQASVSSLQSQVHQMQERLKTSYPRIDTLPYDVWTSQNQRTLQTWLKILVHRWQTRFDIVGNNNSEQKPNSVANEEVKKILDQMVRDHDLNNEAAERMAARWRDIFERRGAPAHVAEDMLDLDELDAGGLSFLNEDQGVQEGKTSRTAEYKTSSILQSERPTSTKTQGLGHESLHKRYYSMSSRPSLDPEFGTKMASEDSKKTASVPPSLPHLTASGSAHMVSVSQKAHTVRTAIAVGTVYFSNPTPLSLIRSNSLKKGDVLSVSRIAGIMAAKKCPDLIPLCHPIALTHVGVELKVFGSEREGGISSSSILTSSGDMGHGGILIEAKVQCTGQTGVEMEALTAIMGATLSVVDMCKAVDKFQRVQDVRVVLKEGGKSGTWKEEGWRSFQNES